MRIVQVIAGSGRGGTDQVAYWLGEGLRAAGHQVIYAAHPGFLRHFGLGARAETVWPMECFRGFSPRRISEFKQRVRGADLVLAHDSGARHFSLMAKALGMRPPLWFMRHCLCGTVKFGGRQLHRLLVSQQIAVSEAVRQSLVKFGFPASRVTRIYAGVNLERFRRPDAEVVERLRGQFLKDRAPDVVVLGMVARFLSSPDRKPGDEDYKGYDLLFQALAKASSRYLVLVLGPESPAEFEQIRRIAAHFGADAEQLRFAGFVRDTWNYFPLMDINLMPSRSEGFGLALVEGMAAGVASVGSRSAGAAEIIEHERTGLQFERGNAADLGLQLGRLARDSALRQELARCGQEAALDRFGAAAMVRAFCQCAKAVLG